MSGYCKYCGEQAGHMPHCPRGMEDELEQLRTRNAELERQLAEAERIWALMPELRNTDDHHELFEAVHEKLKQEAAKVAMLVDAALAVRKSDCGAWLKTDSMYGLNKRRELMEKLDGLYNALSATQSEAEAFIREKQAEALEKLAERFFQIADEKDPVKFHHEALRMAAELRNAKEV